MECILSLIRSPSIDATEFPPFASAAKAVRATDNGYFSDMRKNDLFVLRVNEHVVGYGLCIGKAKVRWFEGDLLPPNIIERHFVGYSMIDPLYGIAWNTFYLTHTRIVDWLEITYCIAPGNTILFLFEMLNHVSAKVSPGVRSAGDSLLKALFLHTRDAGRQFFALRAALERLRFGAHALDLTYMTAVESLCELIFNSNNQSVIGFSNDIRKIHRMTGREHFDEEFVKLIRRHISILELMESLRRYTAELALTENERIPF